MGTIMLGVVILLVAAVVRAAGTSLRNSGSKAPIALIRLLSLGLVVLAVFILLSSTLVVVYSERGDEFRLISARRATRRERIEYET